LGVSKYLDFNYSYRQIQKAVERPTAEAAADTDPPWAIATTLTILGLVSTSLLLGATRYLTL
jgi:hypothetical protein